MINQTNDYSISEKKDMNATNTHEDKKITDSSLSSTAKVVWRSPELSEFDLCMEVTAYVHQWE
jgi:hypothetical protein